MSSEVVDRRIGLGVTLGVDITGVGTTYTILGAIVDGLDGPDAKGTVVDLTLLSERYKVKTVADVDPGEVTFTIAYDPSDATSTQILTGLLTGTFSSTTAIALPIWQISYPATGGYPPLSGGTAAAVPAITDPPFYGTVSGFKRTISKDKMVVAEITIAVSGKPGFAGA